MPFFLEWWKMIVASLFLHLLIVINKRKWALYHLLIAHLWGSCSPFIHFIITFGAFLFLFLLLFNLLCLSNLFCFHFLWIIFVLCFVLKFKLDHAACKSHVKDFEYGKLIRYIFIFFYLKIVCLNLLTFYLSRGTWRLSFICYLFLANIEYWCGIYLVGFKCESAWFSSQAYWYQTWHDSMSRPILEASSFYDWASL